MCVYSVWTHDLLLSFTEARLGGLSKDEAKLCVVLSSCDADCKLYEPSVTIAATWIYNIMRTAAGESSSCPKYACICGDVTDNTPSM